MNNIITLTAAALEQLKEAVVQEKAERGIEKIGIRIGVRGGGCSGYSFVLDIEDRPSDIDLKFCQDDIEIYIDPLSAPYLKGMQLDYIKTLTTSGFKFSGGNITRTCGCGSSVAF